jgi:TetR/AcrR family transcriptional regulator, tetracycline repressor protein
VSATRAQPEPADGAAAESGGTRLDRDTILDTVERIVASEGIEKLTMRRVGSELGADHTALYRHFTNKEAMLNALADRMFSTPPQIDPQAPWQQRLRAHADHAFGRYQAHPDLGTLLARQSFARPGLIQGRERVLEILTEAGLELREAAMMSHLIENHVVGCGLFFAVDGAISGAAGDESRAAMRRAYAMVDSRELPLVAAAAPFLFPDPAVSFSEGLEVLIAEIERRTGE